MRRHQRATWATFFQRRRVSRAHLNHSEYAKARNFQIGESSKHNMREGRREIRSALSQISNVVSDNGIDNCNRMFWLKHDNLETIRLWELGKLIGVTLEGKEKKLLVRLEELEDRDKKQKLEGVGEGGL
ncbi:hypothetical protein VNO80_10994 [Phaseolus coccineus]|uniref:Uncharacterized protein n=1 Tax=Phaseolus coccineus TaxID=3886 RepID=A0AAN9RDY1_PHACN